MNWKHDDLARDLADRFRGVGRMVWEDMQIGPSGSARPDVYTIEKSYTRPNPTVYEVKVSVSDFRADVTRGKWQSYLAFAGAVYFAVPVGLVGKDDVPNGCGLIVRHDSGWRAVKKATMQHVEMPQHAMLKLLIDGVGRLPKYIGPRDISTWRAADKLGGLIGRDVAMLLTDTNVYRNQLESLREQASDLAAAVKERKDRAISEARDAVRAEEHLAAGHLRNLRAALGAPEDASPHELRRMVQKIIEAASTDERLRAALQQVEWARQQVERAAGHLKVTLGDAA